VSYVLVSLLSDAATQDSDAFARWLAQSQPPAGEFHDANPAHAAVSEAVRRAPVALVFGHDGGGTLRAEASGESWATPEQFAEMFSGARVWVYACNTRAPKQEEDLESFGRRAHELGVRVFAGHCTAIASVAHETAQPQRDLAYRALGRAFRAFLRGQNSANAIRLAALRGVAGPGRFVALAALPVEDALRSLRVLGPARP
jgi:hypothetical protein